MAAKTDRTPEEDDMLDMMVNGGKRVSVQNLRAIIIIAAIATPIAKSQHMREIWFYVMSGGVVLKVAVMEIARIIIRKLQGFQT